MSSTTTTWSTDTNTKSGSATTYTDTVSSLKLVGAEGEDAILRLFADEGDDNADQWRIVSQASTNKLNFMSFASGTWSNVISLFGSGTAASQYLSIQTGNKLYLDGGSDTYIHESSADVLKFVVGGVAFLDMTEGTNALVINEGSVDMDFRVESNGNANMLFVDGGENRVGIGTNSPNVDLHIESTTTSSTLLDISSKNDGTNADVGVRFFHGASPVLKGSVGYNAQTEVIMITAGNNFNNSHLSIDSNGNVGIGATDPGALLEVRGGTGTGFAGAGELRLSTAETSIVDNDVLGIISFSSPKETNGTDAIVPGAAIWAEAESTYYANANAAGIVFATANSETAVATAQERMRIANNGHVTIKGTGDPNLVTQILASALTDTDYASFRVAGTGNSVEGLAEIGVMYEDGAGTNAPTAFLRLKPSDGANNYMWFSDADDLRFSATSTHVGTTNGTVIGTQTSDERLKNISSDPFPYGLDAIKALTPIKYTYKETPDVDQLGFGAQTTKSIVPESVFDTKECIDGYTIEINEETGKEKSVPKSDDSDTKLGMEYVQLIPVLVKAVQELSAKVEALENK